MKFTLFTPVFNREKVIERVWHSIQRQTFRDFEWICVDDGSQDGSIRKLEEYRDDANFPVTILKNVKNEGKHVAWNRGVEIARGGLFVPCDSDDEFDPDALEFFSENWDNLSEVERKGASGINVLCRDNLTKQIVGNPYPRSPMWSNNLELYYRFKVTGEKWGCIRTDLLKQMPFPEGQGYSAESYLWFTIARTHQALCINKSLRTYFRDQNNKISTAIPRIERLPAMYDYACWHIRKNWDYIKMRPLRLVGEGSNVFLRAFVLGISAAEARARLHGSRAAAYWPVFAFIGWLRYHKIKPSMRRVPALKSHR